MQAVAAAVAEHLLTLEEQGGLAVVVTALLIVVMEALELQIVAAVVVAVATQARPVETAVQAAPVS